MKKLLSIILATAIAISGAFATPVSAEASVSKTETVEKKGTALQVTPSSGTASAGVEQNPYFSVNNGNSCSTIYISTEYKASGTIKLYSSSGAVLDSSNFTGDDYFEDSYSYYLLYPISLSTGYYKLGITFNSSTYYEVDIYESASISSTSLNLTKGFSKKLKVTASQGNTISDITWSSSNKNVKVDKNGKITGSKKGTATVTAKGYESDGTPFILDCLVYVRNNVYTSGKLAISDVSYGNINTHTTKISYDKKGNLVLKIQVINRDFYSYNYIKGLKITVKDASGKKVATYKASKKKFKSPSNSSKTLTVKIAKKKVKQKRDIAGGTVNVSGTATQR